MTEPPEALGGRRTKPARRIVWIAVLAAIALAVLWAGQYRHRFLPKRFHVVEPAALYRSGYLEPGPLRRVLAEHRIGTILCLLNDEPDNADQQKEASVVRETGVGFIRIGMPGDGRADFDALDRAADAIADPANRPLLVHCAGGENRTGAAYAAYRMKHCGWSFEQAVAEGARFGLPIQGKPALADHLRAYQEHLAARRMAAPAAATGSRPDPTQTIGQHPDAESAASR